MVVEDGNFKIKREAGNKNLWIAIISMLILNGLTIGLLVQVSI